MKLTYTYERRGLLKTEARTILGTLYNLAYGYDYNGNRNSLTYPDSSVVSYGFDWAGRPISATSGSNTYVSSATYEPFGPIQTLMFGNGSTQTFSYDQRYRPSEDKLIHSSTTIADYIYQEDSVGNITQINDNTNSGYNRAFGYDDLNRLTTANSGSSLWGTTSGNGYTFDYMGNLKTIQLGSGRTASFAYSGTTPNLTSVTENGSPRSVSYDAVGNELSVGSASYAYTPRNLLSSGDSLSYAYDGWGRREVSTTSSGSRYSFYGPDMTLLSESNVTSGTPVVSYDYIYFGGRPIAQSDSTGVHYTAADHLGTPLLQTDSSANVYWRAEDEPYGKVWALRANDVHQPLRLPGQVAEQFDTGANGSTERSYNIYRWYRPGWARFTQNDPTGLMGGTNPFAYAGANPVGFADSQGLRIRIIERPADLSSGINSKFFGPFYHTLIVLEPDDPKAFGFKRCYLEALNDGGWLNKHSYTSLNLPEGLPFAQLTPVGPTTNSTTNDTIAIAQILTYFEWYSNSANKYSYVEGVSLPWGYNSNSFVAGALSMGVFRGVASGSEITGSQAMDLLPGYRPGQDEPIYFDWNAIMKVKAFSSCTCR